MSVNYFLKANLDQSEIDPNWMDGITACECPPKIYAIMQRYTQEFLNMPHQMSPEAENACCYYFAQIQSCRSLSGLLLPTHEQT